MRKKAKRTTQRQALNIIRRELGLTAGVVRGEYRIDYRLWDARYRKGPEGTSYYTNDPVDAVATARVMAAWHMDHGDHMADAARKAGKE